ncbi:hypothetical protein H4R34_000669 [Dimargaris verticillata]|uniref:propionyl-CoA carboxylase n=1 Tax=Dimargaris verticillata TaxID=2761393 RepID=A0A9W8B4X6_9FUNG|nr:hypothetical protein H4R34_000669 [Dimargaris verticillata]
MLGSGAATLLRTAQASRAFHASSVADKYFNKILVANRGEIACRVIRSARKLGIETVAIYSDADASSLHVQMADEAINVGPAPTSQSYLNIDAILNAIHQTKAEAVHPGYGFLSENATFVEALHKAGVTFIGPGQQAMAAMGDKIQSKVIAAKAGVNIIPGFNGVVKDTEHALQIANDIGYPVMIKASAGGGGKGMRIAYNDQEVRDGFQLASTESLSSFGDSRLLIEKFIEQPRHIEIQILADTKGNVLYLPERECSIQRRNQKVIEEAPSTHLDAATRKAMGEQAVSLAKGVNYASAGTVEFLVDAHRQFYFLEMNTRLQVEHPITEYITGIDLVEEMIRVAAGHPLDLTQADVPLKGWAIESRVYAEDPEKYLPSIGTLRKYQEPHSETALQEVRCDSGIVEGSEISIHYDPMISKLCTYGRDRNEAIANMKRALDTYVIQGVTHNVPLLRDVISHPEFVRGNLSTKFLAEYYPDGFRGHQLTKQTWSELVATAGIVHAYRELRNASLAQWNRQLTASTSYGSNSAALAGQNKAWQMYVKLPAKSLPTGAAATTDVAESVAVHVKLASDRFDFGRENEFEVAIGKAEPVRMAVHWDVESPLITTRYVTSTPETKIPSSPVTLQYLEPLPLGVSLQHYGTRFDLSVLSDAQHRLLSHMKEKAPLDLSKVVLSPMPGRVISITVKEGDVIAEGEVLAVVEAMKMQNALRAPKAGKVKAIHVAENDTVGADDVMIELDDE